jgi:hypothetical protein
MADETATKTFLRCSRFVYCRPVGGLNDSLCEIERAWSYAERSSRALIIDTQVSGLMGQFSTFFSLKGTKIPVFPTVTQELLDHINKLSAYPDVVTGRFGEYTCTHIEGIEARVEIPSNLPLSFDLSKIYEQGVLLRESLGGGHDAEQVVKRITLKEEVRVQVKRALELLPSSYVAVHVRNTDYITDYKPFFEQLFPKVTGRAVLVCSDDQEVLDYAKEFFELSTVVWSSQTPVKKGMRLHADISYEDEASCIKATINSLIDLFALSGAERLYYTDVTRGRTSGFSMLANFLHKHRDVRLGLLG